MSAIQRTGAVMFAAALVAGVVLAQDESKPQVTPATAPVAKPTRAELKDKQVDVSLETRDIERVLTKVKRASELAKTRIAEAATTAESASTALEKGDSKAAREQAQKTSEMYKEIIKQLEALLAEETPQRIAAARNLANQLAKLERQFAQQFPGVLNPIGGGQGKVDPNSQVMPKSGGQGSGGGAPKKKMEPKEGDGKNGTKPEPRDGQGGTGTKKEKDGDAPDDPKDGNGEGQNEKDKTPKKNGGGGGESDKDDERKLENRSGVNANRGADSPTHEERREALARRAEQLEKMGETLKDVLQAISQSNEPADKEAVAKLEAILKETELMKSIEAMKDSAEQIRSEKFDDARLTALDIAERLEIVAQRLDAAYRAIVAPQAEELRKLEQALATLREKLDTLETEAQIAAWHREAQDLLDQAEKLGISDRVREDLLEQMKKAGLGVSGARNRFNWGLVNNRYQAPDDYSRPLLILQEEVQARIQNLLLGDISDSADEATPPKYQELVEQYYRVLSGSGKSQISNSKSQALPKSQPKPKSK